MVVFELQPKSQIFKQQIIQGTFLYGFMQPAAGKGRSKWGICLGDAFWERQNWARKISEFAWVFEESDILIGAAFYLICEAYYATKSLSATVCNLCMNIQIFPFDFYIFLFKDVFVQIKSLFEWMKISNGWQFQINVKKIYVWNIVQLPSSILLQNGV